MREKHVREWLAGKRQARLLSTPIAVSGRKGRMVTLCHNAPHGPAYRTVPLSLVRALLEDGSLRV